MHSETLHLFCSLLRVFHWLSFQLEVILYSDGEWSHITGHHTQEKWHESRIPKYTSVLCVESTTMYGSDHLTVQNDQKK